MVTNESEQRGGERGGDGEITTLAAIVLVFRLFTYWLPTLPSWVALNRMQKRGDA